MPLKNRLERNVYQLKWAHEHPEKMRVSWAKYNRNHREERQIANRKYRREHLGECRAALRKWHREHPEANRKYRREHRDELRAYFLKWNREHRELNGDRSSRGTLKRAQKLRTLKYGWPDAQNVEQKIGSDYIRPDQWVRAAWHESRKNCHDSLILFYFSRRPTRTLCLKKGGRSLSVLTLKNWVR